MVEIEGSISCMYMSIRVLSVLVKAGVCRDTTRGCRAIVDLHAMVGVNWQHLKSVDGRDMFTRCVPVCAG